jgi:hypothetical protein
LADTPLAVALKSDYYAVLFLNHIDMTFRGLMKMVDSPGSALVYSDVKPTESCRAVTYQSNTIPPPMAKMNFMVLLKTAVCRILGVIAWEINVILDANIIMFVSNIRAVFSTKLMPVRVLFPCHYTNKYHDTGVFPALGVLNSLKCGI